MTLLAYAVLVILAALAYGAFANDPAAGDIGCYGFPCPGADGCHVHDESGCNMDHCG